MFTEILNIVDLLGHPTVVIVTGVWTCACTCLDMVGHGWTWLDMGRGVSHIRGPRQVLQPGLG